MPGWNSKAGLISRLRAPKGGDQSKVNNTIFDMLNNLTNSVNRGRTTKELPQTAGKSGDVRIAKSSTGGYHIEAKTDEGWIKSDSGMASGFDFKKKDDISARSSVGWIDMELLWGWTGVSGYPAPSYRKKNGIVYLRGRVTGGVAANSAICTLPQGFRPGAEKHTFLVCGDSNIGAVAMAVRIDILGSLYGSNHGDVYPVHGYDETNPDEVSLEQIFFFTP